MLKSRAQATAEYQLHTEWLEEPPPPSPGLLTSSKEQEHKEPLRAASPDFLNVYSEVWAVALGEECKADLYSESIHQRMCPDGKCDC